jgi:hypothetical protein
MPPTLGTPRNHEPSARNNAPAHTNGKLPHKPETRSAASQTFIVTRSLPILVIARRNAPWQSTPPLSNRAIAQITADGLPRAFGPRNDEVGRGRKNGMSTRNDTPNPQPFIVTRKEARGIQTLVIARSVATWQSTATPPARGAQHRGNPYSFSAKTK